VSQTTIYSFNNTQNQYQKSTNHPTTHSFWVLQNKHLVLFFSCWSPKSNMQVIQQHVINHARARGGLAVCGADGIQRHHHCWRHKVGCDSGIVSDCVGGGGSGALKTKFCSRKKGIHF